jgi:Tol biopolymer transport system component
MWKKSALLAAAGTVLSLSPVAFSQPLFGPPVNLGPKVNTPYLESDPFLTADGKKLFFAAERPDGFGQEDIWFSEWTDTGWTNPVVLGPQINSFARDKSPSVSPDGQKLYYVIGSASWDIFVSTWDSSINDWVTPVNVGPPVNTPGAEFSARLGPDGRHLYFSSVSSSPSRCGFYVSEWNDTSWSEPQSLGVGGCDVSEYPSTSANGLRLYYDSYVSDGKSIFTAFWNGASWGPSFDLRPDLGGNTATPFVTPTGDSLFFTGCADFPGFGVCDIWITRRFVLGDLNLDSQLTTTDIVLELNKVFLDTPYAAPERLGDLNCDSAYSPADAVLILLRVFGMISSLDC